MEASVPQRVVLVTDIFGRTLYTDTLTELLSVFYSQVEQVDPYDGEFQTFGSEPEAYDAFLQRCGHETYLRRLAARFDQFNGETLIMAFSAGASAAWRLAATASGEAIKHLLAFYPGQIRNHMQLRPRCPVSLVFPHSEQSFDVAEAMEQLASIPDLFSIRSKFEHGFINPLSANFYAPAANSFKRALEDQLALAEADVTRQWLLQHWQD